LPSSGFFGLTIVGSPLILIAVGARGFIVGFTVGFLVAGRSGEGVDSGSSQCAPQNLCYIPAVLGAGALSLYFSFTLLRSQEAPYRRLGVYSLLFFSLFPADHYRFLARSLSGTRTAAPNQPPIPLKIDQGVDLLFSSFDNRQSLSLFPMTLSKLQLWIFR